MPSALVTGASRGIGKAVVEHLASRGWDVIAGVRTTPDAEAVTDLNPQRISPVNLDVTSATDITALDAILPDRLDALVNNAGVVVGEEALTSRRPRARYIVGIAPKVQVALLTKLPTRVRDRVLRQVSSQP